MRLAPPDFEHLNTQQQAVHDAIAAGPRGGVRGPLAIWLHRPVLAERAQSLGEYCRFDSALEPRLSEVAILVTARFWGSEFEWLTHKKSALAAKVSPRAIEAIRCGEVPVDLQPDEMAVHDFALRLHAQRTVDEKTYQRAASLLGDVGVVDLVAILGYYTLISMTLNVFEVPIPEGGRSELGRAQER